MKLNCDLGESFGQWKKGCDEDVMPLIDWANVACGFHASDPLTMQKTVKLAAQHNVTIGAHPSYPDIVGFGRRSIVYSPTELIAIIHYQIGALQAICASEKCSVSYVKPHGALYNDMMSDHAVFHVVCQAISVLNETQNHTLPLIIQALPDSATFNAIAAEYNVKLYFEAFADRAYQDNGLLVSRNQKGAVIHDPLKVIERCQHLIKHKQLLSINNTPLDLHVDTLCVHGDNPSAVELVSQLRHLLDE